MTKEIEKKKKQIAKLQKEVGNLALKEVERAKKAGKSFDEIFELWLNEDVPKKNEGWLIHMKVEGSRDIWSYIDHGEPARRRTYSVQEIVEDLEECHDEYKPDGDCSYMYLTGEQVLEFKKQLMERNIGSTPFDW
jgi:hypothetical protein